MADEEQTETDTEEESSEWGLTTEDGETTEADVTDKGEVTEEEPQTKKSKSAPSTTDRAAETDKQAEETCAAAAKIFCKVCTFCLKIYNDKYKRQVVVASVIFLLALKLANECHAILIPTREYPSLKR